MRQGIETIVYHAEGVAQVLLATCPSGQIGEIGGDARIIRGTIILIEINTLDGKREISAHCYLAPRTLK